VLLLSAFQGAFDLALAFALFDRVALIADVFAAAEAKLDLDDALLEVDLERDQRKALCINSFRARSGSWL
jgi:hypothetical protein